MFQLAMPSYIEPPSDSGSVQFSRRVSLRKKFLRVRALTEQLVSGLSDADASVQAMPDASPAKWHLAHTTWFFETFVLRDGHSAYEVFDTEFHYLFNSYYEAEGPRLARNLRGVLTRPTLETILAYREYVTAAILARFDQLSESILNTIELGCNHEEQHQELLQTDVMYLFSCNPLLPAWWGKPAPGIDHLEPCSQLGWIEGRTGPVQIGHIGSTFAFDCEVPRHTTWLTPHALSNRLVTNREWVEFVNAGGYRNPSLWLSDGWAWVKGQSIESPLYWKREVLDDGAEAEGWTEEFGPCGKAALIADNPVRNVSYYEADAFARWYGARLPTEAEWESAATDLDPHAGTYLDGAHPAVPAGATSSAELQQMFGELWQWTASAFMPYPGFRPAPGAVGEYNGKFMSGQFVLRGGSCATPRGHVRATYRNFFYPHQRWQFTGVRLAKDL